MAAAAAAAVGVFFTQKVGTGFQHEARRRKKGQTESSSPWRIVYASKYRVSLRAKRSRQRGAGKTTRRVTDRAVRLAPCSLAAPVLFGNVSWSKRLSQERKQSLWFHPRRRWSSNCASLGSAQSDKQSFFLLPTAIVPEVQR